MKRSHLAGVALVIAGAWGIQLPGIGRPFGWIEQNPAIYYGPFVRNWDRLGFLATRGVPLYPHVGSTVDELRPYFNHPPGAAWLFHLFGTSETSFRIVTLVAMVAAALCLWELLSPVLGLAGRMVAVAAVLLSPAVAVFAMGSAELFAVAAGLLLMVGVQRIAAGRRGTTTNLMLLLSCAIGPWTEWPFTFFCAGAAVIAASRSPRAMVRRLWFAAVISMVSAALVLTWRAWAEHLPGLRVEMAGRDFGDLVKTKVIDRPPWGGFLASVATRIEMTFTLPFAIAMAVGCLVALRCVPRHAVALAIAGFSSLILFGFQGDPIFCAYAAPFAGLCWGILLERIPLPAMKGPAIRIALAIAIIAVLAVTTRRMIERDSTTFLRDSGRVLTAATKDEQGRPAYTVTWDLFAYYGVYIESPDVFPTGVFDPIWLKQAVDLGGSKGLRHLWFRVAGVERPVDTYLAGFPKRRVPELEGTLQHAGGRVELSEVWLVTLREPPR